MPDDFGGLDDSRCLYCFRRRTALSTSPIRYGALAAASLLLLRLAIGGHFYLEGVDKLRHPKPFTGPFFAAAKGPFAEFFHRHVWDAEGTARLDAEQMTAVWGQYISRARGHFGFDEAQSKAASAALDRRSEQLTNYLADIKDDLAEYRQGLARREAQLAEPARTEVPSLKGQTDKWDAKLKGDRGRWLATVDSLSKDLQRDVMNIATPEQRQLGDLAMGKPGRRPLDSETFDHYVPYFDLTLGVLLVLGLAVRPASLAGAVFLGTVVATQWPGSPGAAPVFYQTVECCALLALAGTNAGRIAGLDTFVSLGCRLCCRSKKS